MITQFSELMEHIEELKKDKKEVALITMSPSFFRTVMTDMQIGLVQSIKLYAGGTFMGYDYKIRTIKDDFQITTK